MGRRTRQDDIVIRAFGRRMRALRHDAGLSQERLAHHAGMDRTYVSGIERGIRNPSLRNISRIARALGVDVTEMFG